MEKLLIVILISMAGPVIGSLLGVCKKYTKGQVDLLLAFAAGIMVSVSIFELLPESYRAIGPSLLLLGLAGGSILMYLLNAVLPHFHLARKEENGGSGVAGKTILFVFLGISIHNFPEGAAIGIGALSDFHFSLIIALAIALHDIPEAVCVAAPYYFASASRLRAVGMTLLTSLPTVAGILLAYFAFGNISDRLLGFFISLTAGIMVYISFFELMPYVYNSGRRKAVSFAFFIGMIVVLLLQTVFEISF